MKWLVPLALVLACRGSDPPAVESRIGSPEPARTVVPDAAADPGTTVFDDGLGPLVGVLDRDELDELSAKPLHRAGADREEPAYSVPRPAVRFLTPVIEGELLVASEVRDAEAGSSDTLLRCYDRARVASPRLIAAVKVRFTITPAGRVTGAAIVGSGGRLLDGCVLDAIRTVVVPRHAALPTAVVVTQAIAFL